MLQYLFSFLTVLVLLMLPAAPGAAPRTSYYTPPLPPPGVTGRVIDPSEPYTPPAEDVSAAPDQPDPQPCQPELAQPGEQPVQPSPSSTRTSLTWSELEERGYAPYHGSLIYEQDMGENLCALTFDDGPSNYTPQLLDILDAHGVSATFFMLGVNAAKLPHVVRRVVDEGHEVASHSYKHPNFKRISTARRLDELERTNRILRSCGADPTLFRPPYGAQDHALAVQAAELGLRIVTWSYDTEDWKRLPADYTRLRDPRGRIAARGHLRGIFLFHDIHKSTVDDIPRVIAQLKAGGCDRFVTVSDYISGLLDPEPPMRMTMHRRARSSAVLPAYSHATPLHNADAKAAALAARLVSQADMPQDMAQDAPSGEPALTAWQGYARDAIRIQPPQSRFASLTQKLKNVFSHDTNKTQQDTGQAAHHAAADASRSAGQKAQRPALPPSSFPVGRHVLLPEVGSKSYIVRPIQRQPAGTGQAAGQTTGQARPR